MKLFVIAALIAVSAAARLEHLEQQQQLRTYLPPDQGSGFGSNGFGASPGSYGAISGTFGTPGARQTSFNPQGSFPSTSNQYLPPNQRSSSGTPQFAGSIKGFGDQSPSQEFGQQGDQTQFGQQDSSPQGTNSFGSPARYQQPSAVNSQYTAPQQNTPQQPFDEQTGYHY